jgi:aldose 1-epimerase
LIARKLAPLSIFAALVIMSCSSNKEAGGGGNSRQFGKTAAGETVELYTLKNTKGAEADISTYGGVIVSLKVPDRSGVPGDIVLGFDDFDGYLKPPPYFGAIIGRYGNRIAHGKFTLDGVDYTLAKNDGENSLHGGKRGFDKVVWKVNGMGRITTKELSGEFLNLTYISKDGEEGYPGNLSTRVTYTLTDNNELQIDYKATTDKDTVLNLTNHSYFNLAGQGEGDILAHQVTIHADRFTPVDKGLIPTGELRSVDGTPFDFRQPHAIGERINSGDEQLVIAKGYDHNWVLNRSGDALFPAAKVTEAKFGRVMEVLTTEPGLQFYTGNFLDGTMRGKVYGPRAAFCMETQHFPDSPNQPSFPSVVLKPGSEYHTTTIYRFSTDASR